MDLKQFIINVPDFPQPGIQFKDITPLLSNGAAFNDAIKQLQKIVEHIKPDIIVAPEARGFIFACPIASNLKIPFVPIRKPNKLPRTTISSRYELEYATNSLAIHTDSIKPNQKVLIIDDLLATGGTIDAIDNLVTKCGGIIIGCLFLIELSELKGRQRLTKFKITSLLQY